MGAVERPGIEAPRFCERPPNQITWTLLIVDAVFLCRLIIVQFAIHVAESSIRTRGKTFR